MPTNRFVKQQPQFLKVRKSCAGRLTKIDEESPEAKRVTAEITNAITWSSKEVDGKMRWKLETLDADKLETIVGPPDGEHRKIWKALRDQL